MADRAGQRLGRLTAEPDRRMRPLHGFGLDRQIVDLAETAVERDPRLVGPGRLHQLQPFGETADEGVAVHPERGEIAAPAAGRHADIEPAVAEPVDGGDRRGQLQRIVQRRDQHGHAQPQPLGAGRGLGQQLQRRDQRCRADGLLERPAALETEFLGPLQVVARDRRHRILSESNWWIEMENLTPSTYGPGYGGALVGRLVSCLLFCLIRPVSTTCERWPAGWTPPATTAFPTAACSSSTCGRAAGSRGFDPLAIITGGGRPLAAARSRGGAAPGR